LRDEILGILMSSRDRYISGEVVSQKLGVTRAAVWKHIKRLKDEGFLIDSVPNRGYRLNGWPDRLESAVLKGLLHTEEIGRCLEVHSTIDSTNIRCKELALKGAPHGTLILAEEQQRGRGRLGRTWVSPEGTGLWMSLLLRPALVPSQAFRITMVAALAVARAIKNTSCVEAGIKWPNDIIMGGRKVCGILTEVQVEPEMVQYAVVGIGVNVNNEAGSFPHELVDTAGSLRMATGVYTDRMLLASSILDLFEDLYLKYCNNGGSGLVEEYRKASLTIGRMVRVSTPAGDFFEGKAEDFEEDGSLLVRLDDGSVKKVYSGDVSLRGVAGYI
jgi:BirA family biotin operon repressor/biotin-[acetyl-CoA-carboxylase] ligase